MNTTKYDPWTMMPKYHPMDIHSPIIVTFQGATKCKLHRKAKLTPSFDISPYLYY